MSFQLRTTGYLKLFFPATFSHIFKNVKIALHLKPYASDSHYMLRSLYAAITHVGTFVSINHYENTGEEVEEKMA